MFKNRIQKAIVLSFMIATSSIFLANADESVISVESNLKAEYEEEARNLIGDFIEFEVPTNSSDSIFTYAEPAVGVCAKVTAVGCNYDKNKQKTYEYCTGKPKDDVAPHLMHECTKDNLLEAATSVCQKQNTDKNKTCKAEKDKDLVFQSTKYTFTCNGTDDPATVTSQVCFVCKCEAI